MTIEERAQNVACEIFNDNKSDRIVCKNSYILGANQQREIDIQKAVEWLKENRYMYDQTSDYQFLDMIQQLTKSMKGE